jgi:outer membrane protein assembly factor BamE (lipoprotein component of BamABCDE complex)
MNYLKVLTVATAMMALSGCVVAIGGKDENSSSNNSSWKKAQKLNNQVISQLNLGTALDSVRGQLGTPDFSESFREGDNETVVLFYRTHHQHSDGETTKDECTPLVFKNGVLTGWGEKAYRQL